MLRVENLSKHFGGTQALKDVNFEVKPKEIIGIIGPNGSGKSTLLHTITGIHKPDKGSIWYEDKNITSIPLEDRARLGIGRTFQNLRLFKRLTVWENMLIPAIQLKKSKKDMEEQASELLNLVNLTHLKNEQAQNLSIGQQRLLEFIRAMMLDSKIVLLDEPTAGFHPNMIQTFIDTLLELNRRGKTFVIIEHNIPAIMEVSTKLIAIAAGEVLMSGNPEEVHSDAKVVEAYLG
ncbi:ATP-binding cassette domain-containing protein [Aquibacillus halophilus]|uniref:ATP-binding cassette domain-containing protein n=1 Tax=Aquibacillus halophilus TaxID=930132 RepID=A0A6A8D9H7_9BACI|nr:ABC transporter ATP-binding protein [Aquibacillus halophilus]MRH41196.1 ATP-binding cassette domain-containing protein [Aquibacillus halophilus]